MPVEYVDLETAKNADGLRMVVVTGVPSPWGEAAKGILHAKQIPWLAVRLDQSDDAMAEWTGERSGPVAIYADEAPRGGFIDILLLAERLAPEPPLLPADAAERALALGLCHELCGEMGLAWCRRNAAVHAGISETEGAGFPKGVAHYLSTKYGYRPEEAATYTRRVAGILHMLGQRLAAQSEAGSRYLVGDSLTAVDIYFAACMSLLAPLPAEQCAMSETMRAAFEATDPETVAALDPSLLAHRDFVYAEHLELPLTL